MLGLVIVTLWLDGIRFLPGRKGWPVQPCPHTQNKTCVQNAIVLGDVQGLTLTSSGIGTVDGNGASWWGAIQYLLHREDRPRLLTIKNATDVLVERWNFLQSRITPFMPTM